MGRGDGEEHGIPPFLVGGFIKFERNPVGADALALIRLGAPTSVEAIFHGLAAVRIVYFQTVTAVLHRQRQAAALPGGNAEFRGSHQLIGFGET